MKASIMTDLLGAVLTAARLHVDVKEDWSSNYGSILLSPILFHPCGVTGRAKRPEAQKWKEEERLCLKLI